MFVSPNGQLPLYVKEAMSGVNRSHTVDLHQLLETQCLGDNLQTGAILQAHALLATEKARLHLATLEGAIADLQNNGAILVEERNQAIRTIDQLKLEMVELKRLA